VAFFHPGFYLNKLYFIIETPYLLSQSDNYIVILLLIALYRSLSWSCIKDCQAIAVGMCLHHVSILKTDKWRFYVIKITVLGIPLSNKLKMLGPNLKTNSEKS
jgi:hypothetical protein